jgi:L-2-hydroxycarboxylate dehydrogenase (NAD+)
VLPKGAGLLTRKHGGLLLSKAEIDAFNEIARECGEKPWDLASFKTVVV